MRSRRMRAVNGEHPCGLMGGNQGPCCLRAAELFGLTAEEVYLVHDELDKPLGKLALKLGGSSR